MSAKAPGPQAPSGGDGSPAPPAWFRALWRGGLFLALAAFFALSALLARALLGGFGWAPGPLVAAAAASLAAGAVVLPLAAMVDLPLAIFAHWLPARRAAHGRCPACGYDTAHAPGDACPECHARLAPPAPYIATWATLRRGAALALPAWIAGCAVGLAVALQDEHAFTVEVRARLARDGALPSHARPRAGVAGFAQLRWSRAEGFAGVQPLVTPRERGWRPGEKAAPGAPTAADPSPPPRRP